jgi:hypothetical protein
LLFSSPILPKAFTLPFVPEHQNLRVTDIVGLVVICGGLVVYRFAADFVKKYHESKERSKSASAKEPLLDLVGEADKLIRATDEDDDER